MVVKWAFDGMEMCEIVGMALEQPSCASVFHLRSSPRLRLGEGGITKTILVDLWDKSWIKSVVYWSESG